MLIRRERAGEGGSMGSIYRQAGRLFLKGAPFHAHPAGVRGRGRIDG